MNVLPFKAEHFNAIDVQDAQAYVRSYVSAEDLKALETPASFTCVADDHVLACFGWMPVYAHRATVWAYLSKHAGPHMTGLTRVGRRMMQGLAFRRLEMEVDCEFEQGHRWAKMLGFTMEVERLCGFRVDGGDSAIYSRIQ